jgi:hypothetical protein
MEDPKRWPFVLLAAVLLAWNAVATGRFAVSALVFFLVLLGLSVAAGDVLLRRLRDVAPGIQNDLPTRLVVGALFLMLATFIAFALLPLSVPWTGLLVGLLVSLAWWNDKRTSARTLFVADSPAHAVFIVLCLAAVTLWRSDSLDPVTELPGTVVVNEWPDAFFHSAQIAAFASARGLGSVQDVRMAGARAEPYHFAPYVLPALLSSVTPTSCVEAFSSFFVPFGLLLTALGTYVLMSSLFGEWPAMAGSVVLTAAPDAFQQGLGNPFLGYHWLQQIGPAGPYGVALVAIAWALMIHGCRRGSRALVLASYLVTPLVCLVKAQLFVANALLVLLFPVFFFPGIRLRARMILAAAFTAAFVLAAAGSQRLSFVPTLRLDGSAVSWYGATLLRSQEDGPMHGVVSRLLSPDQAGLEAGLSLAIVLFGGTFGAFGLALAASVVVLRHRVSAMALAFPVIVAANYLIQSVGLALNTRPFGTREELLHRPLVWAYVVVCSWCAAAWYAAVNGNRAPSRGRVRWLLAVGGLLALLLPLRFSRGLQTVSTWPEYRAYPALPACQYAAARYIRAHGATTDLVQDSLNDPRFVVAGLSERQAFAQAFALDRARERRPPQLRERLRQLAILKRPSRTGDEVREFAERNGIGWYLANPGDGASWASLLPGHLAFECEGYRVFAFRSPGAR